MTRHFVLSALFSILILLLSACTHVVGWDPINYQSMQPEPKSTSKVLLYVDDELKNAEYSFRAFGSGIANKWVVPYGERVHQFAEGYLSRSFAAYSEVESPGDHAGAALVNITGVEYEVSGQAAHVVVNVKVADESGSEMISRAYKATGPSGHGGVIAGGAFAQKGMVRRSTNRALHEVFTNLVADIRGVVQ